MTRSEDANVSSDRILLVGKRRSMHLYRWSRYLDAIGSKYDLFSMIPGDEYDYRCERDLSPRFKVMGRVLTALTNPIRAAVGVSVAKKYGIVHVHSLDRYQTRIALGAGNKLIVSCLGSDILVRYRNAKGAAKKTMRRALDKANVITCDSPAIFDALTAEGIPKSKIRLISWGVDTNLFRPLSRNEREEIRRNFGIPETARVLLSMRSATPFYRILEIIEQFRSISWSEETVLFLHISPFSDAFYVEKCLAAAKGIPNIVINTTDMTPQFLYKLYAAADIDLHFPQSDAAPVSMLEGMACGNAILCDRDIPAYRLMSEKYMIGLIRLADLDDTAVTATIDRNLSDATGNRAVVLETDSLQRTVALVECLMRDIASSPDSTVS